MAKEWLQNTGRRGRVSMTLLFCILTTVFMATAASASVDFVNQWSAVPTIVSNGNTGTVTGKFTPAIGSNRLMLVAVATEYSAAQAPAFTVTYGGQTVTQIITNTAQNNKIWLGYLNQAGLVAAGSSKTLSVTTSIATNLTAIYATAAVFSNVNQTTPITGSNANATASATTLALTIPKTANAGLTGNTGMTVYLANWNGQTSTPGVGFTELQDYTGTNFRLATCYKVTAGTANETPTTTAAAAATGAAAGVSINPILNVATLATCGDCHGNPPMDGVRNVLAGAFVGSHEKHGGGTDVQYSYACTTCHYNNTLIKHANALKNISGSKLPRNAYLGGNSIAISNAPANTTCTNTACHSTGRTNIQYTTTPAWGGAATTCLSCHAGRASALGVQANSTAGFKLSSSHSQHLKYPAANINCNHCHGSVASDAATLKNYSGIIYHADGTNQVVFKDLAYGSYTSFKTATKTCDNVSCHGGKSRGGWQNQAINTTNTCVHCHGVAGTSAALPNVEANRKFFAPGWGGTGTSTDQLTVNTDVRVGGHFVHLSSVYMKRLKCNECHIVPATAFDGTHMTGPRYSSQSIAFTQASTAIKNATVTAFTSGTAAVAATCTTTYCHGSKMPLGDTGGTAKSPLWNQNLTTGTPGTAECARCHGNPPLIGTSSGIHAGATATTSCITCHPLVVNGSGAIINKALHMNGLVEAATTCNGCHDYDTRTGGTVWGNTNYGGTVGMEGRGAHAKHIEYLKTRNGVTLNALVDQYSNTSPFNVVCGVCHSTNAATDHTMGNPTGTRAITFPVSRQFGAVAPLFNGLYNTSSTVNPKTCSNLDCHYKTTPAWSSYP